MVEIGVRWECPLAHTGEDRPYRIYQPAIPQAAMEDPPIRVHFAQVQARELAEMIDAHNAEWHR